MGYIVGFTDDWANNLNTVVIGYYESWDLAIEAVKKVERYNIDQRDSLCEVYILSINTNETKIPKANTLNWIDEYDNYKVRTFQGKTILKGFSTQITIDLPIENDSPTDPVPKIPESAQNNGNLAVESFQWKHTGGKKRVKKTGRIRKQ